MLKYGNLELEYFRFGGGYKNVIALHGFGQSGMVFGPLADALGQEYTVLSISLPHHGKSSYSGTPIAALEFRSAIIELLTIEGIEKFTLIGYSTGGRVSLCVAPYLQHRLAGLVLIAPDGVVNHPLYTVASQTWLGRCLHGLFVTNSNWLYQLASLVQPLGLFTASQLKFLKYNSQYRHTRKLAFNTWGTLRYFKVDINLIQKMVSKTQVPFLLIYGKHDRIIPAKQGVYFTNVINGNIELRVLNKGHNLTKPEVLSTIASKMKNPSD